ncbi:MAG: PDZ domain-containing protein [Bryobacteraceae bacterium]
MLFLCAALSGAAQEATVGLIPAPLYSPDAKGQQGPAVVLDVMENTPAAKAGIRNGDLIVAVNGADLEGQDAMETLKASVIGLPGGSLKLTLFRISEGRQFQAELTRVPFPLRMSPASQPFQFSSPGNWRPEVDNFPLPWSPQLSYNGVEDLVFAPGFDDTASPNYHSYAFVWWLEGKHGFTTARLESDLVTYYKGISEQRGRTRKFTPDLNRVSVTLAADGSQSGYQSFHGDAILYSPAGSLITLHGEAVLKFCTDANHTAGVFILSPKDSSAEIWKDLRAIRASFRCSR